MSKTIRIRCAVVVDSGGVWNCVGWSDTDGNCPPDGYLVGIAKDGVGGDDTVVTFVEADVPMPERATIEARIVE